MNISLFKLELCGIPHSAFLLALLVTNYYQFCSSATLLAKVWIVNQKCRFQEKYLIFWLKGSLKISRLVRCLSELKYLSPKLKTWVWSPGPSRWEGENWLPKSLCCTVCTYNQSINKYTLRKNSFPLVWFWSFVTQVRLELLSG